MQFPQVMDGGVELLLAAAALEAAHTEAVGALRRRPSGVLRLKPWAGPSKTCLACIVRPTNQLPATHAWRDTTPPGWSGCSAAAGYAR